MSSRNVFGNSVKKRNWAFTFGVGQSHSHYYVKMKDMTIAEARNLMVATYKQKWAFQYLFDDEFKKDIKEYGLKLLRNFVRADLK